MILESIIKTTKEITQMDGNEEWVPLESYRLSHHNAQVLLKVADNTIEKLEDENTQLKEANYDLLYENAFLKEDFTDQKNKIIEANKILDTQQICRNCITFTDCDNCPLNHLEEVLK